MKKVILSFITLLSLFALHASVFVLNKGLSASLRVEQVPPSFSIYGGLSAGNYTVAGTNIVPGQQGPINELSVPVDLTSEDVVVYIKVVQSVSVNFFSSAGFDICISATALRLDGTDEVYKTNSPEIVENSYLTDTPIDADGNGSYDFTTTRQEPNVGTTVTYRVTYPTGVEVPRIHNGNEIVVGGFAYKWEHKEDLIAGKYIANVVLQYTVV